MTVEVFWHSMDRGQGCNSVACTARDWPQKKGSDANVHNASLKTLAGSLFIALRVLALLKGHVLLASEP